MSIIKQIYSSLIRGPIYLIIFGLIFFGIGARLSLKQIILERYGTQADGEVISLTTRCDDDGCSYSPVVRFETQYGNKISFESTYSSSPPSYEIGERVTVIYPQETPERAEIKGGGMVFRIIFMIVGGVITSFGLGLFYINMRADISISDSYN